MSVASKQLLNPRLALLVALLFPPLAHAEYEELTALKKSSHHALQRHARRMSSVPAKFEGVVRYGQALQGIKDVTKASVPELTVANKHYWRAVLEMAPTDPSVLFAHAHLHAARGETAHAEAYLLLGSLTMASSFRKELDEYQELKRKLDNRIEREMRVGIGHHDNGEYTKALKVYDAVISEHPNSAWAFYEKGFAYLAMTKDTPELERKKEQMYSECRRRDPFYLMAYQGSDQKVIQKLLVLVKKVHPFVSGKQWDIKAFAAFAEGCEEMELFPFSAHARWKLAQLDAENLQHHIRKFLDLLPKCGCKEAELFRKQFSLKQDAPTKPSRATQKSAPSASP